MDIASILNGSRNGTAAAGALAAVAGVTALDLYCAQRATADAEGMQDVERAETSLMINCSPAECYRYWRELSNFPNFVRELKSVQTTGDKTSHWVDGASQECRRRSSGMRRSPRTCRTSESPGSPSPASDATVNGSVNFEPAPGGRGTIIRVQMDYDFAGPFDRRARVALARHESRAIRE